jgi:phosphate uptake regulator
MTGGSTYTVSIPKAWANARDIDTGSPMLLYPFDDRLVVARPESDDSERRTVVDVDIVGEGLIRKRIEAAYAAGSDEISVESATGFTPAQRSKASGAITDLIGVEIAEETERKLVAKSLLDPTEVSLDGTLEQLRTISLSMHEDAASAALAGGEEAETMAEHIASRDDDVDRLFALLSRQFYRLLVDVRELEQAGLDRQEACTQFRVGRQLERVADHAERIAEVGRRFEEPPAGELPDLFDRHAADARQVVATALDGNADEALMRRERLLEALEELDRELYRTGGGDVYLYGRLLESIRRTAEYGGNVAEIVTLGEITDLQ